MKSLSPALQAHLDREVLSLCWCWRLLRRDGVNLSFTTHDSPVTFEHMTYRPVDGFLPSAISSSTGFNVDNLDVSAVLSAGAIREQDILAGRYDHARVEIFQLNWAAPEDGRLRQRSGWIGEVTLEEGSFTAEIRGLAQKLQQPLGAVCSPECRAELGAERCHVDLARFARVGKVTSVPEALGEARQNFTDAGLMEPDGWYAYGLLRWVSGGNAGLLREVRSQTGGAVLLQDPLPEAIRPGDIYHVRAGCDKRAATCRDKFNNIANFRGESRVPGHDSLYYYPGLK